VDHPGRLGPLASEAIPSLRKRLEETDDADPETSPQRWALSAVALFGREARGAAPQLIDLLHDEQSSLTTRLGCLEALSQIGSAAPEAIAAIWKQLEAGLAQTATAADHELALGAAEALGMIGPDASAAVPILLRAAQHSDVAYRRAAVRSLGQIGSTAQDARPVLLDALAGDDDPLVRDLATTAFGQLGSEGWPLIEPLFTDKDAGFRARAANAVATWKEQRAAILPAMESLLVDDAPSVRLAACRSWRQLMGQHDRVWTVLTELLTDTDRLIRREASRELQRIALQGNVTAAELDGLLQSPHAGVRQEGTRLQRLHREYLGQ